MLEQCPILCFNEKGTKLQIGYVADTQCRSYDIRKDKDPEQMGFQITMWCILDKIKRILTYSYLQAMVK